MSGGHLGPHACELHQHPFLQLHRAVLRRGHDPGLGHGEPCVTDWSHSAVMMPPSDGARTLHWLPQPHTRGNCADAKSSSH